MKLTKKLFFLLIIMSLAVFALTACTPADEQKEPPAPLPDPVSVTMALPPTSPIFELWQIAEASGIAAQNGIKAEIEVLPDNKTYLSLLKSESVQLIGGELDMLCCYNAAGACGKVSAILGKDEVNSLYAISIGEKLLAEHPEIAAALNKTWNETVTFYNEDPVKAANLLAVAPDITGISLWAEAENTAFFDTTAADNIYARAEVAQEKAQLTLKRDPQELILPYTCQ